jgi:hypothetical protein
MKTSDSLASWYCGKRLSVLRAIAGTESDQPKTKGPWTEPKSEASESWGKLERPGLVAIGTDTEAVPVTGLAANFSLMPRIAPPPLGSEAVGAETAKLLAAESRLVPVAALLLGHQHPHGAVVFRQG